jgi:arginase
VRSICLIEVPLMCGDGQHLASDGPPRAAAAARELLGSRGIAVSVESIPRGERTGPPSDAIAASLTVNRQLASIVRRAIASGQLPLIVAGSCDASLGVLAGFQHASCGIVWVDAHGDFNTPQSSVSGFFPGMSLAILTGHCYEELWGQAGENMPVSEAATVLLGVRDLSPAAEQQRLEASAIQVVRWEDGRPQGNPLAALGVLAQRVKVVYLHVDLDALDPHLAPGIVDDPVAGGLSLQDAEAIVRTVTRRFRIMATALTPMSPIATRTTGPCVLSCASSS